MLAQSYGSSGWKAETEDWSLLSRIASDLMFMALSYETLAVQSRTQAVSNHEDFCGVCLC